MKNETIFETVQVVNRVIPEAEYPENMDKVVLPLLERARTTAFLSARGGHRIYAERYSLPEANRGSILISHGFTEGCEKYREMIYYFLREGYQVCIFEHRDHGRSRDGAPAGTDATYVDRFRDYVEDMDTVVNKVLTRELPAPYYLYAHSMGGLIGALYLQQHPGVFEKAVLNAPMFEINRGGMPLFAARAAAELLCLLGKGRDFLPGQGGFSHTEDFAHSAATSPARYRYYFRTQLQMPCLQSAGSSCRWAREGFRADARVLKHANCAKITIPVLLFQAEKDDYVLPGGQEKFISSIPNGKLLFVPGAKHEIYLSDDATLNHYLQAILDFLRA